ncbi:type I restriction endonuclease subunit R [Alloscardovia criceti]|uniref:type I restriction endonuclease subunit R n=1 Tax=Alloscardovia criceti TaxID=356828 RepID=UPI000367735D|nr:HsdR family type I site-specific deoxyribonuclease [Alloscardovia criceti]
MGDFKGVPELEFERQLIEHLTQIGGVKQWQYSPEIKTTQQLWANFKRILEQNNRARLDAPLSDAEFSQVKREITKLSTPFQAGQFLYGTNGVSEVLVHLDNGEDAYLQVFDQAQVGGGNTVYQVVNQIERPSVIDGKPDRRFDVTLLINGLPIIQIELKQAMHSSREALNQMEQYIAERQYGDIFSTLQILIAMTPNDIRYMANTTRALFNKAFAFNWQNENDSTRVHSWKEFADKVLSIPMAHDMATRFMVLDGTRNKQSIKVMRPYQVYATKRVLDKVRGYDFSSGNGKLGYVWHTTGSGKTITSFKTAWLASLLPNVDKVIFLVDRIALTNQTVSAYQAYDPDNNDFTSGVIADTANISDLHRKLMRRTDKNIIVTSIQKMARYVSHEKFSPFVKGNILFIVDEAHRSTSERSDNESMLQNIRKAIPQSAWVGYTGTPKFPETQKIFGNVLHTYTIREAIADKNVLGFNVEFKETIKTKDNPTAEEIDDDKKESVYDTSPEHLNLVVQDIFKYWNQRSNNRKYNALLTVHVGGHKPSTPRAMQYFHKFLEENAKRPADERLKVAVSFSVDTSNGENQLPTNEGLDFAMAQYNAMFGTAFERKSAKQYTEDLARRLNKTSADGRYLDLAIVVDQLLTGFDAPELNTLYVDRTLKGANLIQAYSRTNRMHNILDKPWGNVVNYRWPKQNEEEMNDALLKYSNRQQGEQGELDGLDSQTLANNGVLSVKFSVVQEQIQDTVNKLRTLTRNFTDIPNGEKDRADAVDLLRNYSTLLSKMKQYTKDDEGNEVSATGNPEDFYNRIGLTPEQEVNLTTFIFDGLKQGTDPEPLGGTEEPDISMVELEMVRITEVIINYDYLTELIAQMSDAIHDDDMESASQLREDIGYEIAKSESDSEKAKLHQFVDRVYSKEYALPYPAPRDTARMNDAMDEAQSQSVLRVSANFIRKWGLDNTITPHQLESLISRHRVGMKDLDKQNQIDDILRSAQDYFKELAAPDIAELSKIRYRNMFRTAIYELADEIKKYE